MNVPECAVPFGADQVPPPCGDPPSALNNERLASVLHTVMLALVPAFGFCLTVMFSVAVALVQGAVPVTV
jgi:hypothetical protein